MVLQHIARGGAAQRVVLPRRSFLKGFIGLIAAPAVIKAESLMPIVVWRPEILCISGGGWGTFLTCRKDDLLGVDPASLGLPPPFSLSPGKWYWRYVPLVDLPRDRVRIPQQARLEREIAARAAKGAT
jgi:hypothetical protein